MEKRSFDFLTCVGLVTTTFFTTGLPFPYSSGFSGEILFFFYSRNFIYMIICNHRFKQNLGETKWRLKHRFNEHRRPVYNPSNISKPTTVSEHFLTNDHSANDITRIPLEIVKSNRDSVRKARKTLLTERNGRGSGRI